RWHLHHAFRTADQVINYLATVNGVVESVPAGSLRRWNESVGTIRVVSKTNKPETLIRSFLKFPLIVNVVEQSDESCLVKLADGSKVAVRAASPADFPLALFSETGAPAHVAKIQKIASGELKVKSRLKKS